MIFNKIYEKIKAFIKENYIELIIIGIVAFASFYNLDYVVYRPGGAIDLSEKISIDNKTDVNGSYSMSYVTVANGNLINIIASYFVKDWDIVKKEEITYSSIDYDTTLKIDRLQYKNSLNVATYVAYNKAKKQINIKNEEITVLAIDENATTDIELLDKIISIDGKKYNKLDKAKDYLTSLNVGTKVKLEVQDKNNQKQNRYAYIYEQDGNKIIGVALFLIYDFETNPQIEFEKTTTEAGSSGGLMLTLSIYDTLVDEDLAKGRNILGTGTIDENGKIGEIGGIKYKLLGANKNHADIFFVPKENYKEAKKVYKKYNMKFKLIKVETIDDAIDYLTNTK